MTTDEESVNTAKKRIDEEIVVVQSELTALGFPADGTVEMSFDEGFADAAHTTSERARALSLAEGLRERMAEAKAALVRIEAGTYGTCQKCGKQIPPERLEAVPTTRLCISCKQKAGQP